MWSLDHPGWRSPVHWKNIPAANRLQKPNAKLVSTTMMLTAMRCATICLASPSWQIKIWSSTQWWSSLSVLNDSWMMSFQQSPKAPKSSVLMCGVLRTACSKSLRFDRSKMWISCRLSTSPAQMNGRILRKSIGSDLHTHIVTHKDQQALRNYNWRSLKRSSLKYLLFTLPEGGRGIWMSYITYFKYATKANGQMCWRFQVASVLDQAASFRP